LPFRTFTLAADKREAGVLRYALGKYLVDDIFIFA